MDTIRRSFIKGVALAAGSLMFGASCTAFAEDTESGEGSTSQEDPGSSSGVQMFYDIFETDVLVIGGGITGRIAAIQAKSENSRVLLVDKGPFGSSGAAGMNWDQQSIWDKVNTTSTEDTHWASWTLTNQDVARKLLEFRGAQPDNTNLFLLNARCGGGPFKRYEDGTFKDEVADSDVSGMTYCMFPRPLSDYVNSMGIDVVDETMITGLFLSDGICVGAVGLHIPTGKYCVFRARAVVNCAGPCYQIFGHRTVNAMSVGSPDNTGDITAAAYRSGAGLINAEFFQTDSNCYEPTAFGVSYTSGLGADSNTQSVIQDVNGDPLFYNNLSTEYTPVCPAIMKAVREGRGGDHGGVYADFTDPSLWTSREDNVKRNIAMWKKNFGIDVTEPGNLVKIGVDIWESMVGPIVDENMMTSIPGFFSSRGMGNDGGTAPGLAQLMAQGGYAAHSACSYKPEISEIDWTGAEIEICRIDDVLTNSGSKRPHEVRHAIQDAVYDALSADPNAQTIQKAIEDLESIKANDLPAMYVADKTRICNYEWKQALETFNLMICAEAALKASLMREESRDYFIRTDFPDIDDENWHTHILARDVDGTMELTKDPVRE